MKWSQNRLLVFRDIVHSAAAAVYTTQILYLVFTLARFYVHSQEAEGQVEGLRLQ